MRIPARLSWAAASLLMLAVLLWPAFWNGFPLIFADTGGYLERVFERDLEMGRSAFYGAFLALGIRFEFWPNIVAQAALTVWIMLLALRTHGLGRPWHAAAIVAALCVLTALPFYVSQLMPDCFAGLAVLALYLLAFCRAALRRLEIAGLVAVIAFAIASHMATLALCLALLLAFAVWRLAAFRAASSGPALVMPSASLAAGVAAALLSNLAIAGQFTLTPGGTSFLFGRLVQDGVVARYLADTCPEPSLRLCAWKDELPTTADNWLWGNSPFHHLGNDKGYAPEARRIIRETLWLYPAAHLRTAARAAFDQLFLFKTTASVSYAHNNFALGAIAVVAPAVMPRLLAARQQEENGFEIAPATMPWLRAPEQQNDAFTFVPLNLVHVPAGFVAVALLPVIVLLGLAGRVQRSAATLALTVLLALVVNAAVAGIFSNPVDRYQSRLMWLALLAVAIAILHKERLNSGSRSST